ncbi:MAG: [acyl-carrier-protein] S-malonyltransferase [Planctomycetota bacterium]|nr:MAG: [acyl-carrier-protein] S-malonyltransferase [Planctomycetota bacterium]
MKTALLFPGQGAQTVGMGASLAESVPAAKELFARANEILGYDLLKLCAAGPAERLDATEHSQPALFVCSLAALEKLRLEQPAILEGAAATAGLSLGEYTALVFAGAMDFETGLRLVRERGLAMQAASDAAPSGMVSILGLDREQVERLCDEARQGEVLQVANLLCPGNIVVSGTKGACTRVKDLAEAAGAMKVIPLSVAGAFHTPIMQPAYDRLSAAVAQAAIRPPRIAVLSNVDAEVHTDPDEIRQLLVRQLVSPVLWEETMRRLITRHGIERCVEVGPGRVLAGLLKRIDRKFPCENVTA